MFLNIDINSSYAYQQALVNIPALSESTLRRDIAASDISLDSRIQVNKILIFNLLDINLIVSSYQS